MQITTIRKGFKESYSLDKDLMPNAMMLLPLTGFRYGFWKGNSLIGRMETLDGLRWIVTDENGNEAKSFLSEFSATEQLNTFMRSAESFEVNTADFKNTPVVRLDYNVLNFSEPYRICSDLNPENNRQVQVMIQHKNKLYHLITLYHD